MSGMFSVWAGCPPELIDVTCFNMRRRFGAVENLQK